MQKYDLWAALDHLQRSDEPLNQDQGNYPEHILARVLESDRLELEQQQLQALFEAMTATDIDHGPSSHRIETWMPYTSQYNDNSWAQPGE
jgi:hypothetical protein